MGDLSSSTGLQTSYPKARQFARSPVLFASIQLGKNLQGFILNASEGGVCVQTAREIIGDEPLDLRFQSVRPGGWVQARGRVVWKNETNTVAGLQFIDNNREIATEVRNWLAFGESLQELRGNWWPDTPAAEPPVALPDADEYAAADSLKCAEQEEKELETQTASPYQFVPEIVEQAAAPPEVLKANRYTYEYVRPDLEEDNKGKLAIKVGIGLCVLVLLVWLGLSHRHSAAAPNTEEAHAKSAEPVQPGPNATPAPTVTAPAPTASAPAKHAHEIAEPPHASVPLKAAVVPASGPNNKPAPSSRPAAPSAGSSGLMLQVAAMSEEANANKLAGTLTSQHFTAFVAKHPTDQFYRVLVGPFANAAALHDAEQNLHKAGYQTIEKRWTP